MNFLQRIFRSSDDTDIEFIDDQVVQLIRYINSTEVSRLFMPDVHIKLKFGNDPDKNDLWKAIIYEVDKDFPWNPLNSRTTLGKFCEKCKGWLWRGVYLEPGDLKKAALQAGMARKGDDDVRIQNFVAASKCGGMVVDRAIEEG